MVYLQTLLYNFLVIFFSNHLMPGIQASAKKFPQIGADILFAFGLGFLNSLIYPLLKLFKQEPNGLRIALISIILNLTAYAVAKIAPIAIAITSIEGYLLVSLVASIGGFATNFYEARRAPKIEPPR